jgi:hypothetical protein
MELRDSLSGAVFNNCQLASFGSERLTGKPYRAS